MSTLKIENLPVNKIFISKLNLRVDSEFGDEEDIELINNIRSLGLLQPIVVRPVNEKYEVIVGRRRYLSIKNSGATEITCIVKELEIEEALDITISENIFRKNVDPVTLGTWIKKRLELGDITLTEYAKQIGKSKSTVSEWIRMTDLSQAIRNEVQDGAIPFHYALKVARMNLTSEEESRLATESRQNGFEAFKKAVDRLHSNREKRGSPKGLKIIRMNFGFESKDYEKLEKLSKDANMNVSEYCMKILSEHVNVS